MKKELRLSDSLSLPPAYATSRNMVLAQSGAGKSNVCVVLAEEMYRVGIPWIAIDTKGDWYGIRSNRSGKQRGLDVPVFGGEFGDIPLSPHAGARMAELVAAGKLAGVFDVSDFPKPQDVSRFLTDFANTLLKKQRTPVHLFLEECHDYLPQGSFRGQADPLAAACVGAMKRLATKGRFRGIGYTLISQRAAEVNKTVLYQCETLIALRMIGDLDVKWIEGWVKRGSKRAPELLSTIHELRDGECWVWSPARLKTIARVQARLRETFDSGKTPEIGQARVVPKMAPVELAALRKELADLEEQAKADDPRALRARITELEKINKDNERAIKLSEELRTRVKPPPPVDWKKIEKWVRARLEDGLNGVRKEVDNALVDMRVIHGGFTGAQGDVVRAFQRAMPPVQGGFVTPKVAKAIAAHQRANGSVSRPFKSVDEAANYLPAGERAILTAIAQHRTGVTRQQLTILTGYKRSTRDAYLQRLTGAESIEAGVGGTIVVTPKGLARLGDFTPLPTGHALLEHWLVELPDGESKILGIVASAYPDGLGRDEISNETGFKRSTRDAYIQRLTARQLVVSDRGGVKLVEDLT